MIDLAKLAQEGRAALRAARAAKKAAASDAGKSSVPGSAFPPGANVTPGTNIQAQTPETNKNTSETFVPRSGKFQAQRASTNNSQLSKAEIASQPVHFPGLSGS